MRLVLLRKSQLHLFTGVAQKDTRSRGGSRRTAAAPSPTRTPSAAPTSPPPNEPSPLFERPDPAPLPGDGGLAHRPGLALLPTPSGVNRWQRTDHGAPATEADRRAALAEMLEHPKLKPIAGDPAALNSRIWGMGYRGTCSRCGGTGKYAYNPTDGDKCYGCEGRGSIPASLTPELFQQIQSDVAGGALERYAEERQQAGQDARAGKRIAADVKAATEPVLQKLSATPGPLAEGLAAWVSRAESHAADLGMRVRYGYRGAAEQAVRQRAELLAYPDAAAAVLADLESQGALAADAAEHARVQAAGDPTALGAYEQQQRDTAERQLAAALAARGHGRPGELGEPMRGQHAIHQITPGDGPNADPAAIEADGATLRHGFTHRDIEAQFLRFAKRHGIDRRALVETRAARPAGSRAEGGRFFTLGIDWSKVRRDHPARVARGIPANEPAPLPEPLPPPPIAAEQRATPEQMAQLQAGLAAHGDLIEHLPPGEARTAHLRPFQDAARVHVAASAGRATGDDVEAAIEALHQATTAAQARIAAGAAPRWPSPPPLHRESPAELRARYHREAESVPWPEVRDASKIGRTAEQHQKGQAWAKEALRNPQADKLRDSDADHRQASLNAPDARALELFLNGAHYTPLPMKAAENLTHAAGQKLRGFGGRLRADQTAFWQGVKDYAGRAHVAWIGRQVEDGNLGHHDAIRAAWHGARGSTPPPPGTSPRDALAALVTARPG